MKSKRAREAAEVDDKPVASVNSEAPAKKRKRSEDDGADLKKAKKEKRDKKYKKESRKERKEKRKNLQDLPEQDDDEEAAEDAPMAEADDKPADAPVEADKSAKKDKKAKTDESQQKDDASVDVEPKEEPKKSKKDKKKQNKASETTTTNDESAAGPDAEAADGKGDRHIVFVGNLPFTATAETIKAHFASLNPVSVRCMSDPKDSKPCRGFAFVEFEKVWHMRTCLDKFHHSEFSDGVSYPRRINVELT
jgi:nucleolar protein 6